MIPPGTTVCGLFYMEIKKLKKLKKINALIIFLSGLFSLHLRHQIKYNIIIN
jgi:hypothetical protein